MSRVRFALFVLPVWLLPVVALAAADGRLSPANELGQFRYLVEFAEPGLLHAAGPARGERFDPHAPGVAAHRAQLKQQHTAYRQAIAAALDRGPRITHYYQATHSGMAMWLTPAEAGTVRAMDGVVSVERERVYELATYRGPWFIGADSIWDGSAAPGGAGTRGEGMVVAVLDTGIDPDHPSFANDAACGHGDGGVPDKLLSYVDCSSTDDDGMCDGLLPIDTNSHGTHVASTAAGNLLDQDTDPPPGEFAQISGVAPCAHLHSYKVCLDLSCQGASIEAAMNSMLIEGDSHVMNFSITGGNSPWTDNDRTKLDLVGAGILVAAAAGNTLLPDDPTVGEVNHKGPWVLTVAASTHDGGDEPLPTLSASGPGAPPPETQNLVLTKPSVDDLGEVPDGEPFSDKPVRRAIDDTLQIDDEGCVPYTAGYFNGAVALIQRGTCQFAVKVQLAQAAGADMIIIRNNEPGALVGWTIAVTPDVPVYGMAMADGEHLADFIGDHVGEATVNFEFISGQGVGDVLAGFSLRGPTPAPLQDLTKPDIAAPGVSIFAAEPGLPPLLPPGYGFKSGTSMATPHSAGAAALVRALHPDWTPPEVKSAMMMTATNENGTRPDETTPWDPDDAGSGRVDLSKAALAGLVMHETFDNFLAANPALGGDVKTLNIPAVRNMDCTPSCSWTRTVRNTLTEPATWSASGVAITPGFTVHINPSSFSFSGDTSETQELVITATPTGVLTSAVAFGEVRLGERDGKSPGLHLTVAIMGEGGGKLPIAEISPAEFEFEVFEDGAASDILSIGNNGNADLEWTIFTASPEAAAGISSHNPAADEVFELGDFDLPFDPAALDPVVFTETGGSASQGEVTGFSFAGTASNLGTGSWASDTCMVIEAPDGTSYGVGGIEGTMDGCNVNAWDFQGEQSSSPGSYQSAHDDVFVPALDDAGEWTLTFTNDWATGPTGSISWTGVTVTLHKLGASVCDVPADVDWLSADPGSGATPPGGTGEVEIAVDASGLAADEYQAYLCVATNDPAAALVAIPVTLTVTEEPDNAIFSDRFEQQ